MRCPKCFQKNDDNTLFCKRCGSKLVKQESTSGNPSSILLLVWAIIFFVTGSIQTLITTLVDGWYFGSWRDFCLLVWGVHLMSFILPAVEIKANTMEIIISKQESTSDKRSIILLWVWFIIFFVTLFIAVLIIEGKDDWYLGSYRTFYFLVCAVHNASYILPAVAIKNKTMKIIAIILVAIPTLYYICSNISAIFTEPVGEINLKRLLLCL